MNLITTLIRIIHLLVVIFIVVTPFLNDEYLLSMHFLIVPMIMLHWITNQSICALTEIEKLLTGKKHDNDTFFGKVVGPIYMFKTHGEENLFMWTLLTGLWLITLFKLHNTQFAYLKADFSRLRARF